MSGPERGDAVELHPPRADAPVLLSCEHASQRLPAPWRWPTADRHLRGTHWAYDLAAAPLARALARKLGAGLVLARFSRLLVDPNRAPDDPTLFRATAEGAPVALNAAIDAAEREKRLGYWQAYHDALLGTARAVGAPVVFAVHSFTPVYEGRVRDVEIGILFDEAEALAARLARALAPLGARIRMNEPYSGREGLIYAAARTAAATGKTAVEIEVRQDRAADAAFKKALVAALAGFDWAG